MKKEVNLLDVVELIEAIPDEHLAVGAQGTVVDIHEVPHLAYEVEFCDEHGNTVALVPVLPTQVKVVWRRS